MADTALDSFKALLDSVPSWIADLQDVLDNASKRQAELLAEYQPADADEPLVRKAPKTKSTSSSLLFNRSRDARFAPSQKASNPVNASVATPQPTLLRPQLPHMTDSDALRLSQRKRKTFSAASGDENGPSSTKYRSRGMIVVYYDGDVQNKFMKVVRGMTSARNGLRRGKIGAKMDAIARRTSMSSESGSDVPEGNGVSALESIRSRQRVRRAGAGTDDANTPFDRVDGLLEKAQALCEQAAHQVLRDGDCGQEMQQATAHLKDVEVMAKMELPGLEANAAIAAERDRRFERKNEADEKKRLQGIAPVPSKPASMVDSEKSLFDASPADSPLEVDAIEVDDQYSDDEEESLSNIKMSANMGKYFMRDTRLAAH